MPNVDFSQLPETRTPPGAYLCEVFKCSERMSKKGDAMFEVKWRGVLDGSLHVYDYVMLGGGGADMGAKKLEALGWPRKFKGAIEAEELIGKRAWLFLAVETYQGKASLKPDSGQGSHCGYQPERDTPEEAAYNVPAKETGPIDLDDTPF